MSTNTPPKQDGHIWTSDELRRYMVRYLQLRPLVGHAEAMRRAVVAVKVERGLDQFTVTPERLQAWEDALGRARGEGEPS